MSGRLAVSALALADSLGGALGGRGARLPWRAVRSLSTKIDPSMLGWNITDPVVRFRIHGTERSFDLAASERWLLGSAPDCSLHLDDPSGCVSRRHAIVAREDETWTIHDLGSRNGLRVNRELRRTFQLAPCDEIDLGGITLVAESRHSIALSELLQRWLGWAEERRAEVDRALRGVREMAHLRAMLVLRGMRALAGVARHLHRATLGARPFVTLGREDSSVTELKRAINGTLCMDVRGLPRDARQALSNLRTSNTPTRVVMCAASDQLATEAASLVSNIESIVTIAIPPLTQRADEFERLLEAYATEAADKLGAGAPSFRPRDAELVYLSGVASLDEVEHVARRLVALRNWGVAGGAKRLGITHAALSRWARRRRLPT